MSDPSWTFMSNHGHVLVCLAQDPDVRLRDVASRVGITERAAQQLVTDLVTAGFVHKERAGRRNSYRINRTATFRHRLEAGTRVGDFVDLVRRSAAEPTDQR